MKKIISLLLSMFLLVSLIACAGKDKPEDVVDDVQLSGQDVIYINEDGESVYRIVKPSEDSLEESKRAAYVFKQMKDKLGINAKNSFDDVDGTDAYEILIGNTNRPESKSALDHLYAKTGGRYKD